MKVTLLTLIFIFGLFLLSKGQTKADEPSKVPVWTEADRKYLLDNLIRSKEELIAATRNLTTAQWNFKESPDRWSINQIIEHICLWELIQMNEVSVALQMGPFPDYTHYLSDSLFISPDPERLKRNITTDYSKPFTYGVPLGNNEGKDNMTWLITMTNESIEFLKTDTRNIRIHYINFGPNIHQRYMMVFQHMFRHLGQIRDVKAHPNYPK
ncbi:MAG: DinB family protein [Cyclobacteriaceae bacterium]